MKQSTYLLLSMTQMSKLSATESKIMYALLKALMEKLVCKIKCKFQQRDVNQMEILDMKHSVTEMKNAFVSAVDSTQMKKEATKLS